MYVLITLSIIGSILAIGNLGYILWQKRKYNIANQKRNKTVKAIKLDQYCQKLMKESESIIADFVLQH